MSESVPPPPPSILPPSGHLPPRRDTTLRTVLITLGIVLLVAAAFGVGVAINNKDSGGTAASPATDRASTSPTEAQSLSPSPLPSPLPPSPAEVAADFARQIEEALPSGVLLSVQYAVVSGSQIKDAGSLRELDVDPQIMLFFKGSSPDWFNQFRLVHFQVLARRDDLRQAGFKAIGVASVKSVGLAFVVRIDDWDIVPGPKAHSVLALELTRTSLGWKAV
jgi:hypothetical protein